MTANELADSMERLIELTTVSKVRDCDFSAIATMLRQQAQEIEQLKEELKRYADAIGEERGNKALRNNEIAEILTKVLDDCGLLKKASEK